MKTVVAVFVMILFSGPAFGQVFKKGSSRTENEKAFASKFHFSYRNQSFLYRNPSFLVKGMRGENQFAMMYDLGATRNKYYASEGAGAFNRLLLNNFRLERRWDKSRNRCY